MKRAHIYITGRVQGVGFRHFTTVSARKYGVSGWVKNLPDGRVEAVFEGDEESVEQMIKDCREGPRAGKVRGVDVTWEEPTNNHDSFKVKY